MGNGDAGLAELEWLGRFNTQPSTRVAAAASGTLGYDGPWRRISIIGGGTAGYFAALALQRRLRGCEISLIESSALGIIGVGEATVPHVVQFLHRTLGIDPSEFFTEVQPTWKLGIRFEWGVPAPYHFNGPFDWASHLVGLEGTLAENGDLRDMSVESMMMDRDVTPVFATAGGRHASLLHALPFAYHFDAARLVNYLSKLARDRGIAHIDRKIAGCELRADGGGVRAVITEDGERLEADAFIDCTGFRSLLLEQTLGAQFVSFESSLFTDRALAFERDNCQSPKPYTTARTMDAGWLWSIPQRDSDHCGYVFSSAFMSESAARDEIRSITGVTEAKLIRFRSGRHTQAWIGNVIGIGNSFAFVEPLESTGVLMIILAVESLLGLWPTSRDDELHRRLYNQLICDLWDQLRWFISIHYKFNRRSQTSFWQACQAEVDVSGVSDLLAEFTNSGPLRTAGPHLRNALTPKGAAFIPLFGVAAFDCILLGQKVETRWSVPASTEDWRAGRDRIARVLETAVSQRIALREAGRNPDWLREVVKAAGRSLRPLYSADCGHRP